MNQNQNAEDKKIKNTPKKTDLERELSDDDLDGVSGGDLNPIIPLQHKMRHTVGGIIPMVCSNRTKGINAFHATP